MRKVMHIMSCDTEVATVTYEGEWPRLILIDCVYHSDSDITKFYCLLSNPTTTDLIHYFIRRVPKPCRCGDTALKWYGVAEYNPEKMCRNRNGVKPADCMWCKFENDTITYKELAEIPCERWYKT